MSDTSRPVSLSHPCLGKHYQIDGKTWRVASVHVSGTKLWAWLVNIAKPMEQVRLSVSALPGSVRC